MIFHCSAKLLTGRGDVGCLHWQTLGQQITNKALYLDFPLSMNMFFVRLETDFQVIRLL